MECEAEDQAEATHAQHRSWFIACVRGRGVALKHFRNTFVDEERLHTIEMDYCFPLHGSYQGITVPVIKEMKTKAVGAFMVPSKELSD